MLPVRDARERRFLTEDPSVEYKSSNWTEGLGETPLIPLKGSYKPYVDSAMDLYDCRFGSCRLSGLKSLVEVRKDGAGG